MPCEYGIVGQIHSHNPITLTFHEWAAMLRDAVAVRRPAAMLGQLFGPPEHAHSHRTPSGTVTATETVS